MGGGAARLLMENLQISRSKPSVNREELGHFQKLNYIFVVVAFLLFGVLFFDRLL